MTPINVSLLPPRLRPIYRGLGPVVVKSGFRGPARWCALVKSRITGATLADVRGQCSADIAIERAIRGAAAEEV